MANGNNSANVAVAKPNVEGAIYAGPTSTTAPTNAADKLPEGLKCLGYISEDGLTNAISRDSESYKAWGGATVGQAQTSYEDTFNFKMIETKADTMKIVFGDSNVTGDDESGLTVLHNEKELGEHMYVVETVLGTDRIKRIVIPRGVIQEIGDIVYRDEELLGYEVTVLGLPDTNGNSAYEYIAKAVATSLSVNAAEAVEVSATAIKASAKAVTEDAIRKAN